MSRVKENNKVIDGIEFMCEHREDSSGFMIKDMDYMCAVMMDISKSLAVIADALTEDKKEEK